MNMCIRIFIILLLFNVFSIGLFGQSCQPDTTITIPGIYPDSATGIAEARVNQAYNQTITIVVPADTLVVIIAGPPQEVFIDSIIVDSVIGAPVWLTVACSPSDCKFIGGGSACIEFSGTPPSGEAGKVYPLSFVTRTHGRLKSFPQIPLPAQVDTVFNYYFLKVNFPIGINASDNLNSWGLTPNPVKEVLTINFNEIILENKSYQILDFTGKVIRSGVLSQANTQVIQVNELKNGIYFLQINGDNVSEIRKFIKL
jgi:Secretion system C-terminal sorting domain